MPYYQLRDAGGDLFWVFGSSPLDARTWAADDDAVIVRTQDAPPTTGNVINDPREAKGEGAFPSFGDPGSFLELSAPQAAFRKFLGTVGYDPEARRPTRQQQAAQAQYDPLSALFVGRQVLQGLDPYGEDEAVREEQFEQFLRARPGAVDYREAQTAAEKETAQMGVLAGKTPTAVPSPIPRATGAQLAGLLDLFGGLGGELTPYQQQAIRPQTVTQGRPLANIGLQALGQSISPLAAQYFNLPSQEELATRYLGGGGVTNYSDFIVKRECHVI